MVSAVSISSCLSRKIPNSKRGTDNDKGLVFLGFFLFIVFLFSFFFFLVLVWLGRATVAHVCGGRMIFRSAHIPQDGTYLSRNLPTAAWSRDAYQSVYAVSAKTLALRAAIVETTPSPI